jgi:NAD(P)-dependent dehydrogenase (short-subunit alcohol dehydrogenase family)
MTFDLTGKNALVTGATSGLGRHFAKLFASAGAGVAIAGRRQDRLDTLKREIESAGGRSFAIALDVTDAGAIAPAFDRIEAALGPLDILVNNAGMSADGRAVDLSVAEFDAVVATNLRAPFLLSQEIARRLMARKASGRIINISSITAFRPLAGSAPYSVSKAGLSAMTQVLAREWARHDINVNAICPGYIETELNEDWFRTEKGLAQIRSFPRRRLQEASDLDGVMLLLASDASHAITGSLFTVDEGQSL